MPSPLTPFESSLRFVRLLHGIIFLTMLLYPAAGERMPHGPGLAPLSPMFLGITALALAALAIAAAVRLKTVQPALELLHSQSNDASVLSRWKRGAVWVRVFLEMVVLCGLVLRVMGSSLPQVLPFYLIPIILMLVWWPRQL
jgi:hypothetical protein